MFTQQLLDAIVAKLAQDFPDSDTLLSVEVFADWLAVYKRSVFDEYQGFPYQGAVHGPRHSVRTNDNLPKLSPTGRKPSQPEFQELPKGVSVPGMFGDLSRYNKDRQPVDVYKATAEQILAQSRSYNDLEERVVGKHPALAAPYGVHPGQFKNMPCTSRPVAPFTDVASMLETEWTHLLGDCLAAYVPAEPGGKAAFSIGRVFLGRLNIVRIEEGPAAVMVAREYLRNLQRGAK